MRNVQSNFPANAEHHRSPHSVNLQEIKVLLRVPCVIVRFASDTVSYTIESLEVLHSFMKTNPSCEMRETISVCRP